MQKPRGSIFATVGAIVLTVVAATTALAVNGGILRTTPDTGVGDLETVATVTVDSQDPNVRYITVFVDDPVPTALSVADPVPVVSTDDSAVFEGEHEADHEEEHEADHEEEHDEVEHEYEGGDDDD